jgi:hypothetical protein
MNNGTDPYTPEPERNPIVFFCKCGCRVLNDERECPECGRTNPNVGDADELIGED